jgi:HAD superfamily hydrolase (TIGR01549 family)
MTWITDIQAIGWDLDGTLYRPGTIPLNIVYERQLKAVVDVKGWDPGHARSELERMYEQLGSYTKSLTALGIDGEAFFTQLWDELPLGSFLKTDKELVALFHRLPNYRHFVLSNSNRVDQIEQKLRLLGLDPGGFEFLLATVNMGAVKPDARPFLAALERLGPEFEAQPERVLYVGDRLETDVVGAHRVGMKAALVWGECEAADIGFEPCMSWRISY